MRNILEWLAVAAFALILSLAPMGAHAQSAQDAMLYQNLYRINMMACGFGGTGAAGSCMQAIRNDAQLRAWGYKPDSDAATDGEKLRQVWTALNNECRGSQLMPDENPNCAARDVLGNDLERRGYDYESGVVDNYHAPVRAVRAARK